MAWFSGRLPQFSSLTDQISSFTKEVLTETTEEVEDPAAELQVARKKIKEIESLNEHIQTEWEKLQRHNEELGERADTAEYQIATISQEYRKLIQEKDNELRRLKAVNENLKEEQKRLLPGDGLTQSPLKELANMRFFPPSEEEGGRLSAPGFSLGREEFGTKRDNLAMGDSGAGVPVGVVGDGRGSGNGWAEEEFHDFGDVISSQGEINRLQSELARVRVECQHWRTLAKEKMASSQSETGEEDARNLHQQIKELQQSLQHEMEQHQRELTALQTVHNERMQSLSRRHELEVSQLQQQAAYRSGDQSKKATETAPLLAREGVTPEEELNQSPSRCLELETEVSRLRNEVRESESARADLQRLRSEVDTLQSSKSSLEGTSAELSQRVLELEEDRRVLEERVGEMSGQLEEVRREKEAVSSSRGEELRQTEAQLKTTEELNAELQSQLQQMGSDRANLAEANSQLVAKLEKEQLQASQLRSEIENMKLLLKQERDAQIRHLEEEEQSRAARLSEMQSSIREHEACITRLQSDHEKSQEEADQLSSRVETLTRELEDKEAEIDALRGRRFQASESSEDLQKRLEESENAELRLRQEVSSLRRSEEELRAQLAGTEKSLAELQPREGGSAERNRVQLLEEQVWKLRSENECLVEELSKTQIQFAPPTPEKSAVEYHSEELEQKLQVESAKRKQLQDHLVQMSEEHDHELGQLVSEKEGLQDDLATLREELSRTLQLQDDSLSEEGSRLKLENSQLFEDLSEQKETISKLREEVETLRSSREVRRLLLPTDRDSGVEQTRLHEAEGSEKASRQDSSGFDDIDLSLYQDPSPAAGVDSNLVERLQGLEGAVAEKERVISKLRASTAALESAQVSLRESADGLKSEKRGLEEKLQAVEREHQQIVARLQKELEAAKRKAGQEAIELRSVIRNTEEKVSELERETSRLKLEAVETDKMASEMLDLRAQLDDKAQVASHHEQNLRELGEVLVAREREVAELRAQCTESRTNEGTLLTECGKLREEYTALLERMTHVEEEARSSKLELEAALRQGGDGSVAEGTEASQREEKATLEQKCAELARVVLEREGLTANLRGKEDEQTRLTAALSQVKQQLGQSRLEMAGKKSEAEGFSRELAALRPQLGSLRREKGELEARLGALEERGVAQQQELEGRLRAREAECSKYTKELERLRAHLIEVEDQHTQEAVGADEREAGLRQRVAELEEGLRSVSTVGAMQSQHSQQQVQDLEARLRSQAAQQDHTLRQLARAEEEAQRNAAALHNLQSVLEQFQRDQSSELSLALKRSQTELADARQECQRLRVEQKSMQSELEEACGAAESAVLLGQELEQREKNTSELTAQVEKLQSGLHVSQLQIERLSKDRADRVDKKLVKNLLMGYFHASEHKRPEVVQLMGKILGFSREELDQAQGQRSGWLSSFWKGRPPTTPTEENKSLSQLFIKFLETESAPNTKVPSSPRTPTTPSSGYIDPKTDPDRPSLATAAVATPVSSALPPRHTSSSSQRRPDAEPLLPTFPAIATPKQATNILPTPTTASHPPHVVEGSGSWHTRQPPETPQPATISTPIVDSNPLLGAQHPDHTSTPTSKPTVIPPPTTGTLSDNPSSQKGTAGLFTFSPVSSNSGPVPREDRSRNESFQSSLLKSVLASHS